MRCDAMQCNCWIAERCDVVAVVVGIIAGNNVTHVCSVLSYLGWAEIRLVGTVRRLRRRLRRGCFSNKIPEAKYSSPVSKVGIH